jgi:SPFH domain / Band 7 family
MFGFNYMKADPTTYVMAYKNGNIVKQGLGLSFMYFSPTTTLVAIPQGSRSLDFILEPITADFQAVTVQGQLNFRVSDAEKLASMLNHTLLPNRKAYTSSDPEKLGDRLLSSIEVLTQKEIKNLSLKTALLATDKIANSVLDGLNASNEISAFGLELLSFSVLAIKPTPETAKALEAEAREAILRNSDEAIYARRNAAVEQERAIRESELDTEVAVELKKRTIRETQIEAEASILQKKHALRAADMQSDIEVESKRREFVKINADNIRTLANAEAQKVGAIAATLKNIDPKLVQSIAAIGMAPSQLIAQAFSGLAENASKIGSLNVSSELLEGLMNRDE